MLIVFCVYTFTFKTHYCYYEDTGKRFHGDCEWEIKEAAKKGGLAQANFFPKRYFCHDLVKNAVVQETKVITVKSPRADAFAFQPAIEITPQQPIAYRLIPEVQCRSGPPLPCNLLRAPPFC